MLRIHYFFCHSVRHLLFTWEFCNKKLKAIFKLISSNKTVMYHTNYKNIICNNQWRLVIGYYTLSKSQGNKVILKYTSKWLKLRFCFVFWIWSMNVASNTHSIHTNLAIFSSFVKWDSIYIHSFETNEADNSTIILNNFNCIKRLNFSKGSVN